MMKKKLGAMGRIINEEYTRGFEKHLKKQKNKNKTNKIIFRENRAENLKREKICRIL